MEPVGIPVTQPPLWPLLYTIVPSYPSTSGVGSKRRSRYRPGDLSDTRRANPTRTDVDTAAPARPPPHDTSPVAGALWATRVQFAALGMLGGAWGVHIPSVKSQYALGEALLSTVLLAAAAGAVISLFGAGRLIGRLGARKACALAAALMGVTLALALLWGSLWLLLPAMLLFGMSMSLFDVAINTEGTALESLAGRPVMSNLHAMFSVGAMAGAALTGTLLRAGVDARVQLAAIGIASALVVAVAARWMLEVHPAPDDEPPQRHFAWPRGMLLVIGLMVFAGMSAEGVMYDWCVLYLKQEVRLGQDVAAMGYAAFAAAMAAARFAGDALRKRYSERNLLRASAGLAAAAMAVVLLSGDAVVSIVGYALVGAGLAPVVPILFNAATRVPGTSRAAAIAAVSSICYAGFMIGPPLIGGLAQAFSLTAAMWVVVLASALLAVGARKVG
jgi:predicted MFS family arabinose efflux permease